MPEKRSLIMLILIGGVVAMTGAVVRGAGEGAIDFRLARQYFDDAETLSKGDAGKLWGKAMYGPMMFVDPATRAVVANQSDVQGKLSAEGEVYVGSLPVEYALANTAFDYAGIRWTMVLWPPPADADARGLLLIHELWHRIQDDLGFPSTGPANAHLDTFEGRKWLRLEWAALREALRSDGGARMNAIGNALIFRAYRRSIFPGAAEEERSLEMHEGLANYTGAAIAGQSVSSRMAAALRELDEGEEKPTYVRSFAYANGPAYGLLLDELSPHWRKGLKPAHDLGALLGKTLGVALPTELASAANQRASAHGGDRIAAEESDRAGKQQEKLAWARAKLVDGPTLHLPFANMKIQFDPGGVIPLGDLGSVYPTATIIDAWGVLTVSDGALIDKNWSGVTVAAPPSPGASPLDGPGWKLQLGDGWEMAPAQKTGQYRIRPTR